MLTRILPTPPPRRAPDATSAPPTRPCGGTAATAPTAPTKAPWARGAPHARPRRPPEAPWRWPSPRASREAEARCGRAPLRRARRRLRARSVHVTSPDPARAPPSTPRRSAPLCVHPRRCASLCAAPDHSLHTFALRFAPLRSALLRLPRSTPLCSKRQRSASLRFSPLFSASHRSSSPASAPLPSARRSRSVSIRSDQLCCAPLRARLLCISLQRATTLLCSAPPFYASV